MQKSIYRKATILLVACLTFLFWSFAVAKDPNKDPKDQKQALAKGAVTSSYQVLNINNLTTWTRHDGISNHSPGGDNGLYYPRGTGNVIYQDGVYHGGKLFVGGFPGSGGTPAAIHPVRVGGSGYSTGMRQGWVDGFGATAAPAAPGDARARAYRIRRDYASMSAEEARIDAQSVNELGNSRDVTDAQIAEVLAEYEKDWTEWPTDLGAPYIERNGTPGYQAPPLFDEDFTVDDLIAGNYDEPGVAGGDPNSPADQVIWTVYNDLDDAQTLDFLTVEPMGLEVQKTVWGYKRTDAMGNLYFARYRYINKGGVDIGGGQTGAFYIDSMYVCQWSDPDLGSFSDDLAGCDSVRSMGFVYNYNAEDATYTRFGLPPAATGYDFLAGPIVEGAPTDTAVFDLKYRAGYTNLGMSSFAYFSAGSPYSDPDGSNYEVGVGQWWKMLRGFAPLGTINDAPEPYAHPPGDPITKFPLSGDPVENSGFLDGEGTLWSFAPGDRRILLNTGPFSMEPGDTQDIVIGTVAGLGADRISSVAVMKANDNSVQETFDLLFVVARPPKNPNVKASEMNEEVVLEWGSDQTTVSQTENTVSIPGNYVFEGYNIYQFPSAGAQLSEARRIATYDVVNDFGTINDNVFDLVAGQFLLKPVQFGTNSGVQRFFRFTRDYVRDINKIYNGQEYYLAVTAYSRATLAGYTAALESSPQIITVRAKAPFGTELNSAFNDTLDVTHTGTSDGSALAYILDPAGVTGDAYQVGFDSTGGTTTWFVRNTTTNETVVSGLTGQTGDGPIVDGVQIGVSGPPLAGKTYSYASAVPANLSPVAVAEQSYTGGRWLTGGSHGGEIFFGGVFMEPNFWGATTLGPTDYKTVEIRFSPMQSYTDLNGDGEYSSGEPYVITGPHTQGCFMYTGFSGASFTGFNPVPFTAWDVSDPGNPVQLNVVLRDRDNNGQWDLHRNAGDPLLPNSGDQRFNYLWITNTPYDAGGTYYGDGSGGTINFWDGPGGAVVGGMWTVWVDDRGTGGMLAEECTFTLVPNFVNSVDDTFSFSTAGMAPETSTDLAKQSAENVGVYPNPYYAFNPAETNRFFKYVTFNNLPRKATFRIFNLAGQMVRTLQKDDDSQFLRWDLNNQNQFPVASGIYIAHIDMPDIGVTKVLKVAIIQEQEVLDSY